MIGGAPDNNGEANGGPRLGFIVGMSRAGTTWLARSLHRHPHVTVFGQTAYWGRRYVQPEVGEGRHGPHELRRHARLHAEASRITELECQGGNSAAVFRSVAERMLGEAPGEFYREPTGVWGA